MIKLIVFDWDDVFTLGSTKGYFACYHETLTRLGIHLSEDEEEKRIKAKWGKTSQEELTELLKERPELVDEAVRIYESILMGSTFVDHLEIISGSPNLLERLSKKYQLAIASGVNPQLLKEKIFPKFSVPDVFSDIQTVYDLDDPTKAKPHPELLLKIMKNLNIFPAEAIMVGDARGDMMMAKSAGVTPVAVLTGHISQKDAEELEIEYILKDVTQIEDILGKIG